MSQPTMTRGSTVLATLGYVEAVHGAAVRETVLATLPGPLRDQLSRIDATAELPYEALLALWHAADTVLSARDPMWMERSGAHSIESTGVQLYSGILRKRSPHEFLTQSVSLFQLYYYPGDMQVVEEDGGRAVLRLSGFDSRDVLFCRRQTGGLRQALVQAGGDSPRVKHVRCAHLDDAFCEWELVWQVDGKEGAEGRPASRGTNPVG
ncbi:MAG: hypothetical protein ABI910_19035 [Gemmatimonadota bacterium]